MGVIAAQLGHADTRMTEKHYAHLAPSYVAQTIRANFPVLGLGEATAIIPLRLPPQGVNCAASFVASPPIWNLLRDRFVA